MNYESLITDQTLSRVKCLLIVAMAIPGFVLTPCQVPLSLLSHHGALLFASMREKLGYPKIVISVQDLLSFEDNPREITSGGF